MATKSLNIKLSVDANQFTSSMGKVNANLRLLKSDLAATTGNVALFGNNLDGLKSKSINLNQQIDQQWKKINLLTEAYQKSAKENGETAEQTQKYERQLNYANAQLSKMQTELADTNTKIREQENSFIQAGNKLQEFSDKAGNVSKTLEKAGAKATTHITLPIIGIGTASVNTAMKFDDSMSQVAGALDKPVDQMNDLRQLALDMGESTIFSASECGQAMTELAKGGLSEADIQAGALQSTMDLAASSGMELGNAANTVVQAMGAFGLTAEQSSQAVNALAGAAAASSTDVEPLTQGLAQCAAQAFNAGWSIQDTTAALGAFADAGITGSDAGTSLKTMLQRLAAPTDAAATMLEQLGINTRDANGNMLSATDMAEELQSKMGQLDSATRDAALSTIFGSDATRAATVFMNTGAEGLKKYTAATNDQEVASRLANAQMSDASRNFEELKGALETAGIAIGETLLPTVTDLVKEGTELIQAFNKLDDGAKKNVANMALLAAGIGPVLSIAGKTTAVVKGLTGGIGKLTEKLGKAQVESKGLNSGLGALNKSFGLTSGVAGQAAVAIGGVFGAIAIGAGLAEGAKALNAYMVQQNLVAQGAADLVNKNRELSLTTKELSETVVSGIEQRQQTIDASTAEIATVQALKGKLDELSASYDGSNEKKQAMSLLIDELNTKFPDLNLSFDENTGRIDDQNNSLQENIDKLKRKYEIAAAETALSENIRQTEEATRKYNEAAQNTKDIQDKLAEIMQECKDQYGDNATAVSEYYKKTGNLRGELEKSEGILKTNADNVNALGGEYDTLMSIIVGTTVDDFKEVPAQVSTTGYDTMTTFVDGMKSQYPYLETTAIITGTKANNDIKLGFEQQNPDTQQKMLSLFGNNITLANEQSPGYVKVGENWGWSLSGGLFSTKPNLEQTSGEVSQSGIDAARAKEPSYWSSGGAFGTQLVNGLKDKYQKMYDSGKETADQGQKGYIDGIGDSKDAEEATGSFADGIIGKIFEKWGIASPSKKMYYAGTMFMQGFINSILDSKAGELAVKMAGDILGAFDSGNLSLNSFLEALGGGMNGINAFIDFARSNLGEGMSGILDRLAGSFFTGAGNSAVAMTGGLLWPSDYSEITSWFGARPASDTNGIGSTNHGGLDIGAPWGAPIYSAGAGVVTSAGWNGGYGNAVTIDLDNGFTTLFGHMSSIGVSAGDRVAPGQIVGLVGSTGNSTGPHLHYSIFLNGQPIDPAQFYGFDVGSRRIPFDMPAMVHKDEMIVPARENPYVNSGGSILGGLFDGLDQRIAAAVARALGGSGERKVEINQVFTDANPSPSEIERKTLNAMRKAALLGL